MRRIEHRFTPDRLRAPCVLQERDRALFLALKKHSYLTTSQVMRLWTASPEVTRRRLRRLFDGGYLEKVVRDEVVDEKGIPIYTLHEDTYALASRACQLVGGTPKRPPTPGHLRHVELAADILLNVELGCKALGLEYIHMEEIWGIEPLRWSVAVSVGGKTHNLGCRPDGLFGFLHPNGKRYFFFIEADRGMEPGKRSALGDNQSAFFKKAITYYATFQRGVIKAKVPVFRVLTVTRSRSGFDQERRLANIIRDTKKAVKAISPAQEGSGLFLFTTEKSLVHNLLTHPLHTAKDEAVQLV